MAQVVRHGADSHYLRPDAVMRSSIIQPMYGYNPGVDAMAVANLFTQPPMGLQGPGLPGFGAGLGPFQRMKLFFQGWWNRAKANSFMSAGAITAAPGTAAPTPPAATTPAPTASPPPGPAPTMVNSVAPQMQSAMAMVSSLVPQANMRSVYGPIAAGAMTLSRRRPYTYYYAG